jgi:predicted PurR-regulated permease PerM
LLDPVLWPLAVAGVLACVLSPVVDFIERRNISRVGAILLVFTGAFALILGILVSVIPQVLRETQLLVAKIPEYSHALQARLSAFIEHPPDLLRHFMPPPPADTTGAPDSQTGAHASATDWLANRLPEVGSWLLKRLANVATGFGLLAGLALVPVYVFYFLLEKQRILSRWKDYLPLRGSPAGDQLVFLLESFNQYLVAFFRGQVLVAVCDAVLYTAGFLMVGVNYAFLLGFAALGLTMIPFLEAIVICLTALLLTFVQYGDWQHPALVLGVFAVVQTLEGLVISPKIMGNRVGLHPLVIIIAVMTGTTLLGGLLGGLLAIPFAAALRVILSRYLWQKS